MKDFLWDRHYRPVDLHIIYSLGKLIKSNYFHLARQAMQFVITFRHDRYQRIASAHKYFSVHVHLRLWYIYTYVFDLSPGHLAIIPSWC